MVLFPLVHILCGAAVVDTDQKGGIKLILESDRQNEKSFKFDLNFWRSFLRN
jgi:hypothetical protein